MMLGHAPLKILCERVNYGRYVDIHVASELEGGGLNVMQPATFERVEDQFVETRPALHLRAEQAQTLTDALWAAGFRPTQGQQSEGQMAATSKHLDDMLSLIHI